MDALSILVLVGYASLLVELCFFALPSEASVYQLFFPEEEGGSAPEADALERAQRRTPLGKLLFYFLPTGLGVLLFLIPLAAVPWPTILEYLVPLPALETLPVAVIGAAAIVLGRSLTFFSVLQLRRMQTAQAAAGSEPRGLFRWSRNPGLCGMYLFYLGNACLFPCVVLFVGFLPYAYNMHRRVLMEESHLSRSLGAPYLDYLARVPRYLPGGARR